MVSNGVHTFLLFRGGLNHSQAARTVLSGDFNLGGGAMGGGESFSQRYLVLF